MYVYFAFASLDDFAFASLDDIAAPENWILESIFYLVGGGLFEKDSKKETIRIASLKLYIFTLRDHLSLLPTFGLFY